MPIVDRHLAIPLRRAARLGEPVLVAGPRGSGKTTLIRREFPGHRYVTLDDSAGRAAARQDPAGFIARLRGQPAVIDDLHRAPELVRHLAASAVAAPLVLASSRRLAGFDPVATFELYTPTRAELERRAPLPLATLGRFQPALPGVPPPPLAGPLAWAPVRNFLDHDVREMVNVHDLDRFERFLRLAEARSGEVLDQQMLAREAGVSHRTVVRWLAVLDACYLTLKLEPGSLTLGRRTTRRPRLHFLAAHRAPFETEVVSEIYRNARHTGLTPELRYWRDSNGFDVPLLVEMEGLAPVPVGIAETPNPEAGVRLRRWMELAGAGSAALVTRSPGRQPERRGDAKVLRYAISQL